MYVDLKEEDEDSDQGTLKPSSDKQGTVKENKENKENKDSKKKEEPPKSDRQVSVAAGSLSR